VDETGVFSLLMFPYVGERVSVEVTTDALVVALASMSATHKNMQSMSFEQVTVKTTDRSCLKSIYF